MDFFNILLKKGGAFIMRMDEIREIAKPLGIKTARMKKIDIVREIQKAQGNFPCFGTADDYCDQATCLFREDCLGKNY